MNFRLFESIKNLVVKKLKIIIIVFFIRKLFMAFFFFKTLDLTSVMVSEMGQDCLIFSILNGDSEAQDRDLPKVSQKLISQVNRTLVPQLPAQRFNDLRLPC